ncbi:response regulator [Maribacter confluentis]|uniref:Response regulator n=1 Tax=Maribacter confluentis TaxID=1656093 RepID=A0ABT8RTX3_9FLAO|nr:response regulator [Maribacter confluentis]MDO1514063.1 response regulator [Maribacter confluentis]
MIAQPLVWVIDDDDISKYVLKRNLQEIGIKKTIEFPDSVEPLEVLSKHRHSEEVIPDIIFLDLNMPILNGFQFLDELNFFQEELAKKIHIFMLTSSLNNKDMLHAKTYSMISEYFVKPLKYDYLVRAIAKVAEHLKEV